MAMVTPEEFEAAFKAVMPQLQQQPNGQSSLADRDFDEITRLLQAFGKNEWSLRPRIYAVLRMINSVSSIGAFVAEGLLDISIPFTNRTLPTSFSNHAARTRFLELQDVVFNEAVVDVERQGSRHRHFSRDGDLYFPPLRELGRGGFATVQLVRSKHSLQEYARKRLARGRTFQRDKKAIANFERELGIYKRLSHSHLVQYVGSYTDPRYVAILLTPVADCNLEELLGRTPFPSGKHSFLAQSYGCLTSALAYVHENCIRHKDIKPSNILIHGQNILLADFGAALDFRDRDGSTTTGVPSELTRRYCSPEVAEHAPRNSSSDIYSLGCVFYEITSVLHSKTIHAMRCFFEENGSHLPFISNNDEAARLWLDQLSSTTDIEKEHIPAKWILETLSSDPRTRPRAADLFERIRDYSTKLCGDCCVDDLSDDTSYAGSVANGVGEMSLDIEDTIRVQSHMRTQSTHSKEEDTIVDAQAVRALSDDGFGIHADNSSIKNVTSYQQTTDTTFQMSPAYGLPRPANTLSSRNPYRAAGNTGHNTRTPGYKLQAQDRYYSPPLAADVLDGAARDEGPSARLRGSPPHYDSQIERRYGLPHPEYLDGVLCDGAPSARSQDSSTPDIASINGPQTIPPWLTSVTRPELPPAGIPISELSLESPTHQTRYLPPTDEERLPEGGLGQLPPQRRIAIKEVYLYLGNLIVDLPVPKSILDNVGHAEPPKCDEFTHGRYSAVTCAPTQLASQRYTLRQTLFGRPRDTHIMLIISLSQQSNVQLAQTMIDVIENIKYLLCLLYHTYWGEDSWKKIVVCIVSNERISKDNLTMLEAMGVINKFDAAVGVEDGDGTFCVDGIGYPGIVNGKSVTAHLFEYCTQFIPKIKGKTVSLQGSYSAARGSYSAVQVVLCLGTDSASEIQTTPWIQGFSEILNPQLCIRINAGTRLRWSLIYGLLRSFKRGDLKGIKYIASTPTIYYKDSSIKRLGVVLGLG